MAKVSETIFRCEFCKSEVPFNARSCPNCGKIFSSVRCPVCGHEGNPELFKNGCPKCEYLGHKKVITGKKVAFGKKLRNGRRGVVPQVRPTIRRNRKAKQLLPVWIYTWISIFLLLTLIVLFVIILVR